MSDCHPPHALTDTGDIQAVKSKHVGHNINMLSEKISNIVVCCTVGKYVIICCLDMMSML